MELMTDRAGNLRGPMIEDSEELKKLFRNVASNGSRQDARKQLNRHATTVNRAFNVAFEFERLGLSNLEDRVARNIAKNARYSTNVTFVRKLFAEWRAWRIATGTPDSFSAQSMSPAVQSTLRKIAESLTYELPHQWIALNLDTQSWARKALKKLASDLDDSALYRESMAKHRLAVGLAGARQSDALAYHEAALREIGVWESLIRWEGMQEEFRDLLVDWCAMISVLAEKGLEDSIGRSLRKSLGNSDTRAEEQRFSLKEPFAGRPLAVRDGKLAVSMTVIPEIIAVILMCDLLTMAASAQESHSAWFKELLELEKLRESALAAHLVDDQAFASIKQWRKLAEQIWELPDEERDDWSLRRKTEELAAMFKAIVVATDELRQQLNVLISD